MVDSRVPIPTNQPASAFRRYVSYAYFLRFSILLWVSLLGLPILGWKAPELTRGIFALERPWNFFFAAFFITLAGCVALLTARVVCAYGEERFDISPPDAFVVGEDMSWRTFLLAQLSGIVLLGYIGYVSVEEAHELEIIADVAMTFVGIAAALVIWSLISIVYHWWHKPPTEHDAKTSIGARAFFLPHLYNRAFIRRVQQSPPPPFTRLLSNIFFVMAALHGPGYRDMSQPAEPIRGTWFRWLISKLPCHAPMLSRSPIHNYPLHSGHALNLTLSILLIAVYCGLFPLTAPVPIPFATTLVSILFSLAALSWLCIFFWQYANASNTERSQYTRMVWLTGLLPSVLLLYGPLGHHLIYAGNWAGPIPAFPSVAPIVMLLIIIFWICTALAFILDRFRIPVLPSIGLALVLAHTLAYGGDWIHSHLSQEAKQSAWRIPSRALLFFIPSTKENLIDFACTAGCSIKHEEPPLPSVILDRLSSPENPRPLIVITATGGGIHAGVWTAEVLAELEHAFYKQKLDFHGSILLLSTVSGGSVGAVPFLRSYFETNGFEEMRNSEWLDSLHAPDANSIEIHDWDAKHIAPRSVSSIATSSLEAISWGIVYPEVFRLLYPARSLSFVNMEEYDRGWAMQQRMAVNMRLDDCPAIPEALRVALPTERSAIQHSIHAARQCLTLRDLAEALQGDVASHVPAVSFNTTTEENGSRFLLANYRTINTPPTAGVESVPEILPAESFLHVYGASPFQVTIRPRAASSGSSKHIYYPDLELLSAARLSATFPYVSPMPRVPRVHGPESENEVFAKSLHFADGGYFDNDGVATATEFLYEAFKARSRHRPATPLPILFIEIRDSQFAENSPDSCSSQIVSGKCLDTPGFTPEGEKPNPSLFQIAAPLSTFWRAGHVSVTRRNHRELELLSRDFTDQFALTRITFTYIPEKGEVQPLSWHLTGKEKDRLHVQIADTAPCARAAAAWLNDGRGIHGEWNTIRRDLAQKCSIELINQEK